MDRDGEWQEKIPPADGRDGKTVFGEGGGEGGSGGGGGLSYLFESSDRLTGRAGK